MELVPRYRARPRKEPGGSRGIGRAGSSDGRESQRWGALSVDTISLIARVQDQLDGQQIVIVRELVTGVD